MPRGLPGLWTLALLFGAVLLIPESARGQQRFDLNNHSGGPIPGLTLQALDGSGVERLACREKSEHINDLVGIFEQYRSGNDPAPRSRALDESQSVWLMRHSACSMHLASMEAGPIKDVLFAEAELLDALHTSLMRVLRSPGEGKTVDEINLVIDNYHEDLGRWVGWLEQSSEFWGGAYVDGPPAPSCLADAHTRARGFRASIGRITITPPGARGEEDLATLRAEVTAAREAVARCEATEDLERVNGRILADILASYLRALEGLQDQDDTDLIEAMGSEQAQFRLLARCREEYAVGSITAPCKPRPQP